MRLLENKVALITGAARGIGRAIALRYAEEGCAIAFTYLEDYVHAQETLQQLLAMGVRASMYHSDASDYTAAHELVTEVVREFGRIDILVNNAGIARDALLLRMSEQQWDDVIDVNLKSAFNYIHAVTPVMMRQRSGAIISLSSVVALNGNAGQANYAASKAGLIALTQSTAKELGSRGIRANCIAPGFIQTQMTAGLSEEIINEYKHMIPMRRMGTPEDVAGVALFLACDMSSYVSGEVVQVNGAMS